MEKIRVNKIEKVKDVLLVVLVFTTILLLYFLWGNETLESFIFNEDEPQYEVLQISDVLVPDQMIICLGNEEYTLANTYKSEVWKKYVLETFKEFSQGKNLLIEEITKAQYETIMGYQGVLATFRYNLPFLEFCERYQIKSSQGFDNIGHLTEIGFSEGSKESVFIFDGNRNKYYRMIGNDSLKIFETENNMAADSDMVTYYKLKTFLGEESNNDALVPMEIPQRLKELSYGTDGETDQAYIVDITAPTYFGETFDFVRKVEEVNGNTVFMYGYGQKVLLITPDGVIEYKEENRSSTSEQYSMFDALDTALAFVGAHGGFESVSGQKVTPYIQNAYPLSDKRNGFRFEISFFVGKDKLFYKEYIPVIIEVADGQVSYFRREFINFEFSENQESDSREGLSAINMLAMNDEYIKGILVENGRVSQETSNEMSFEDLANQIEYLYIGYLKTGGNNSESEEDGSETEEKRLLPVWAVEIDDLTLYFDLYEGEPQEYSKSL